MGKQIVVIGSSNIDLIMQMEKLPLKGETVTDCVFNQTFGGKGANQAVAAARAGGHVTFISSVGGDDFGKSMIANYKKDHINTEHILVHEKASSGTALIMIDREGDNCISVAPGANYNLLPEHIDQLDHVIEKADIIVLQFEIHHETLKHILIKARNMGIKTIFNYAPAKPLTIEYIAMVSVLIINETEAQILTGMSSVRLENVNEAAEKLHLAGVETIIITLGIHGSYISSPTYKGSVNAFKVKAIDATAAGDVYCGTLATRLTEEVPLKEAVVFASAAAALAVTKLGAQPSAPSREEIEAFLKNNN